MTVVQLQVPIAQPLRQQVVDILRDAITSCLFEPGGKLTERVLCERLGVSRGTVREGLRQLEAEGLVRLVPNRGPMVTVLTELEAAECYSLRALLESEASAIAAKQVSDSVLQLRALSSIVHRSYWPTSRQEIWTRRRAMRSWRSSMICTRRAIRLCW